MERFQFGTSPDRVRIAISTLGSGPPAVMIPFDGPYRLYEVVC